MTNKQLIRSCFRRRVIRPLQLFLVGSGLGVSLHYAAAEEERVPMSECLEKLQAVTTSEVGAGENPSADDIANQAAGAATAQGDASTACAAAAADQKQEEQEEATNAEKNKPHQSDTAAVRGEKARNLEEAKRKVDALLGMALMADTRLKELIAKYASERLKVIHGGVIANIESLNGLKSRISQYSIDALNLSIMDVGSSVSSASPTGSVVTQVSSGSASPALPSGPATYCPGYSFMSATTVQALIDSGVTCPDSGTTGTSTISSGSSMYSDYGGGISGQNVSLNRMDVPDPDELRRAIVGCCGVLQDFLAGQAEERGGPGLGKLGAKVVSAIKICDDSTLAPGAENKLKEAILEMAAATGDPGENVVLAINAFEKCGGMAMQAIVNGPLSQLLSEASASLWSQCNAKDCLPCKRCVAANGNSAADDRAYQHAISMCGYKPGGMKANPSATYRPNDGTCWLSP